MGHTAQESLGSNKVFGKRVVVPFERPLRNINKNGSLIISIPSDFVKAYKLKAGKKYQFYIEVKK